MSLLDVTTRAERVSMARVAYLGGETPTEFARRHGLSGSAASQYLNDPDDSKRRARIDGYRTPCPYCGRPMTGCYGKVQRSKACPVCAPKHQARAKKWTRESLIEIILAFERDVGRPPAMTDFSPGIRPTSLGYFRRQRRKERLGLPAGSTVIRLYGSWNAAIAAAGFTPRARHGTRESRREYVLKP